VIKFVIELHQVGGFLRVLRFPATTKTDRHNIAEILLKVALNTITLTPSNWTFFEYGHKYWTRGFFVNSKPCSHSCCFVKEYNLVQNYQGFFVYVYYYCFIFFVLCQIVFRFVCGFNYIIENMWPGTFVLFNIYINVYCICLLIRLFILFYP
jgi:hypothetical protein